jgi:DNA-binding CsgD family transcriptional regulator/catechol 2,3-dioxygenase-like lactoylglutathione lyase family enzyme
MRWRAGTLPVMSRRGRGRPAHPDVLTPAEWRVLDLWRHGLGRGQIARARGVSAYGVRYHLRNIAGKLGVESHEQLRHWPGFPALGARKDEQPMDGTVTDLSLGPLGQVSMYAVDAARTEQWYRETLGLRHVFTFGDLVFFDCGGVRLYIHAVGADEWRKSSILYFLVPDIDAAHRALIARGVHFQGAPHMIYKDEQSGVEEWMAFFDDPDGNTLAVMARVGGG